MSVSQTPRVSQARQNSQVSPTRERQSSVTAPSPLKAKPAPLPEKVAFKAPDVLPLTALFEIQGMAPSPSQTFYHLTVFPVDPHLSSLDLAAIDKAAPKPAPGKRGRDSDQAEPDVLQEIVVNRLKMRKGCVVLRDWPRRRQSQAWTREGASNPGQEVYDYREATSGDIAEKLKTIFGKEQFAKMLHVIKHQMSEDDD